MKALKIGALVMSALLLVMVLMMAYLFMTAEVTAQVVSSVGVSAAEQEGYFSALKTSVDEDTFIGTLYRHDERVADGLQERGQGEQIHEVVEAHEFAGPDALENFEILKGDHQSAHGNILENNVPDSRRQKQQIQTDMILLESFSGSAAGLHRCSDSIPHCTHIL